ncbi:hypothetical protein AAC387_Pa05g1178 [Persea americana]
MLSLSIGFGTTPFAPMVIQKPKTWSPLPLPPHKEPPSPTPVNGASRVSLFEVNLLNPHAPQSTINGYFGVFHVAYPSSPDELRNPVLELILPAMPKTLNILEAYKRADSRWITLTSSISIVLMNTSWSHYAETSWANLNYCKS